MRYELLHGKNLRFTVNILQVVLMQYLMPAYIGTHNDLNIGISRFIRINLCTHSRINRPIKFIERCNGLLKIELWLHANLGAICVIIILWKNEFISWMKLYTFLFSTNALGESKNPSVPPSIYM